MAADKTTNNYELTTNQFNEKLQRDIQKDFKKAEKAAVNADIVVQKEVVKDFDLKERVMYCPPQTAYVTLKDHKENFDNDPKCRLINPAKIEIGKLSKKILSRVVEDVRAKTKLKLWKNTDSVVNWYENLSDKKNLKFIQYDISEYYGNISKVLFTEAVDWATQFTNIDEKER